MGRAHGGGMGVNMAKKAITLHRVHTHVKGGFYPSAWIGPRCGASGAAASVQQFDHNAEQDPSVRLYRPCRSCAKLEGIKINGGES